jgi:hypothetical protein
MKFEQIFEQEGLYQAESFANGYAFRIHKNEFTNVLELDSAHYENVDNLLPLYGNVVVYAGLFKKEYKKINNRNQLFR